ncbi:MAG TPA: ATP-binding protein [Aggregatilineales bacterium]|nr:ATP-binding protein [Aggregatilineales bacterium]
MKPLTVPATLDSLELLGAYVTHAAQRAGLDSKATYRLRLAVDELATNVFTHAYSADAGSLSVQAVIKADKIEIRIEDTGPAFDPRNVKPPDLTLPPEKRPIGGLGVYLVTQSVDSFSYKRIGARNRSILTVRR